MKVLIRELYKIESSPSMVGYRNTVMKLNCPINSARMWISRSVYNTIKYCRMINTSTLKKVKLNERNGVLNNES
jgi:hypothetical protein